MQVKLLALMITICLILCSCSSRGISNEERAAEIQNEYSTLDGLTITANVTADYGERVYDFKLKFTGNNTDGVVEVVEPEIIAGLTAILAEDGNSLVYDGANLSLGNLTPDGLSPMDCIPLMLGQWSEGYIDGAMSEKIDGRDALAVTFTVSEDEYLVTWFENETNLPIRSEIFYDGSMVIGCEFENIVT